MIKVLTLKEPIGKIQNAEDIFNKVKKINIDHTKENFLLITLNTQNQVINTHIVFIGILNASVIHPREIFVKAILDHANSIIIAHNHPSNNLAPSNNDIEITKIIKNSGEILGINLIDHIIFNEKEYYSIINYM